MPTFNEGKIVNAPISIRICGKEYSVLSPLVLHLKQVTHLKFICKHGLVINKIKSKIIKNFKENLLNFLNTFSLIFLCNARRSDILTCSKAFLFQFLKKRYYFLCY